MTDETQPPKDKQFAITIVFPNEWTPRIYEVYSTARMKYVNEKNKPLRPGDPDEPVSEILANYAGALALIKAQFVTVTGLDQPLTFDPDMSLELLSLIANNVALEINKTLYRPTHYVISSALTTSPNGTEGR